jgi:hypothetical protein
MTASPFVVPKAALPSDAVISILGEYIASIHTYVRNRPVVVERERINF